MKALGLASFCAAALLVSACGSTSHRTKASEHPKAASEQVPAEAASEQVPGLGQRVLLPGEFPGLTGSPVYTASAAKWVQLDEVKSSERSSEIARLQALGFIGGAREGFSGTDREGLLLVEKFSSPSHALARLDYESERQPRLFASATGPEEAFGLPGALSFSFHASHPGERFVQDIMFARCSYFYLVGESAAGWFEGVPVAAQRLFYRNVSNTPGSCAPTVSHERSVPAGSSLLDLTWISDDDGWALLQAPCPSYEAPCKRIARTQNGGESWTLLANPPYPPAAEKPAARRLVEESGDRRGVDGLRFATPSIGYLFGPSLLMTRDGGQDWKPVASPAVESLEPGPGGVVGIIESDTDCPGLCAPTLELASPGSDRWRLAHAKLVDDTEGTPALIRAGEDAIYVVVPSGGPAFGWSPPELYRSLNAGRSWDQMPEPCGGSGASLRRGDVEGRLDMISLAAAPGGFLAVLCKRFERGSYSVRTSDDHGDSWSPRRPLPAFERFFNPDRIAAASPTNLLISTGDVGGPYRARLIFSSDGGRHWSTVASELVQSESNAAGEQETPHAVYLGFEESEVGRWVVSPHAIWTTTDGGAGWTRRPFP